MKSPSGVNKSVSGGAGGESRCCSTLRLSSPRAPPLNRASRPGGGSGGSLAHARSVTRPRACALRRRPGRPSPASAPSTVAPSDLLPRSALHPRSGAVAFLQKEEATPRLLFAARFYRRPHGFFFFLGLLPHLPSRLGPGRFASPVDAIASLARSRSPSAVSAAA